MHISNSVQQHNVQSHIDIHASSGDETPAVENSKVKISPQNILRQVHADIVREIKSSDIAESQKAGKLERLAVLQGRSEKQIARLMSHLESLYGDRKDFDEVAGSVLKTIVRAGLERPEELAGLDARRENNPSWYSSNKAIEGVIYVDQHCGTLDKLRGEINTFKALNLKFLHFMPTIYQPTEGDDDGGYAIRDYRKVNPKIGSMEQLKEIFTEMRKQGISPVMDVTLNHTAHDHPWAEAAKAGDPDKQAYYFFMDEDEKNEYQPHLTDIFPSIRKGSFTWNSDVSKYVWTTFKSTQWDLNYANPDVLNSMLDELMFLANQGSEVLRFDAVSFIWKEKGTACFNQDNVTPLLHVFNAMAQIAAPGVVFKAEAINEPKNVKPHVGPDTCQMGYNAMMPTYLWDALSRGKADSLAAVLGKHMQEPEGRVWVNYTRSHDELAFHFDTDMTREQGVDLHNHLVSLNKFFLGNTSGSFSNGLKFQLTPSKVSGTQASLAGIEQALQSKDPEQIEIAISRVKLLNSVVASTPGVSLINLSGGDDRGQINDYSYLDNEDQQDDSRWGHRPMHDIDLGKKDPLEVQVMGRVFTDMIDLNRIRSQEMPAFGVGPMKVIDTGKEEILGFTRENDEQKVLVLANFSEQAQAVEASYLRQHGLTEVTDKIDCVQNRKLSLQDGLELKPYQSMWLVKAEETE